MPLFGPPDVKKLKAKHDVKGLIKALSYSKDAKIRIEAIKALRGSADTRIVEPLIACLKDPDINVRGLVPEMLEDFKDVRTLEPLIACFYDRDFGLRFAANLSLVSSSQNKEYRALAAEKLNARLKDENRSMRINAAHVLGAIGDVRAVEPLIANLKDRSEISPRQPLEYWVRLRTFERLSRLSHFLRMHYTRTNAVLP